MRTTREKENTNCHITKDGSCYYPSNKKYKWVRGKKKPAKTLQSWKSNK